MSEPRLLPTWAEDLRRRYLRGESAMFVLHGNVYDVVLHQKRMMALTEFLTDVLLKEAKETIAVYNVATGVRFSKRSAGVVDLQDLLLAGAKDRVFAALERLLIGSTKTAVIMEYAEAIAPAGDPSFQSEADRSAIVTLHRWSALPLKAVQITSILTSPPEAEEASADREAFIAGLLGGGPDAAERAHKLAALTSDMNRDEIKKLIAPAATPPAADESIPSPAERARREADRLIARRKREIIERECFGLIEFVEPGHGFEVVGGMEEVKKYLLVIAESIREGQTSRVPMGILFTGPMGTGKTFVAEAFARECGLTTIKLKNFRSKWVGATEGNLEKILNVIRAIGQVVVIIDEGDRAFGNTDGEGDGGTSSRVIARIKEFMSDTSNRGRVLFLVMTNRPDKLDVDLKRAGRLDRKIPFLYVQTPQEVELVARALVRKNKIKTDVDLATIRDDFSSKLVGYSNADIEAVLLLANDDAASEAGGDAAVRAEHFLRAADDYFPSRDVELLEYMELLAVFETSSRRLLPAKYASMTPEELDARLRQLRVIVGGRR
ncbi:MAG: AAA family ATPase [Acidobacteria bacterium]|nr:AAA family ATPase [Acidobacteriota bacterium]